MKLGSYFRLMRFNKPVGIALLWFPTAWALWLANQGHPPIELIALFFFGTIIMRAAGCIINDIADRKLDPFVSRTKYRPLASGELSLKNALIAFVILLSFALVIVIQLPLLCFYYALIALALTILYPFCKRFFQAPQVVLGMAFSMGIPMAYSASNVLVNWEVIILIVINFAWIVSYDTMYAIVDRADDLKIGIKSTAVLFGQWERWVILCLQLSLHILWLGLAFKLGFSGAFYLFWGLGAVVLLYQQMLVHSRVEASCFKAFLMNVWYGALMWLAVIVAFSQNGVI